MTYLFSCDSIIAKTIFATTFCSRGSKLYENSIKQDFKSGASTSFWQAWKYKEQWMKIPKGPEKKACIKDAAVPSRSLKRKWKCITLFDTISCFKFYQQKVGWPSHRSSVTSPPVSSGIYPLGETINRMHKDLQQYPPGQFRDLFPGRNDP